MSQGLVLEGVVATGKTTLFHLLQAHPAYVARSATLALSEHYTQRVLEPLDEVDLAVSLDHLDQLTEATAGLVRHWRVSRFRLTPELGLTFLLERYHLSHAIAFNAGEFAAYKQVDERLRFLGGKILLLTIDEDALEHRIKDTRKRRDSKWNAYLDARVAGATAVLPDRALAEHYGREQAVFRALAQASHLPVLEIDTTRGEWAMYLEQIVHFWGLVP